MVEVIVLGMAQDGGIPQAGCACATCAAIWRDPAQYQNVVAPGIVDHTTGQCWMIDATPAFGSNCTYWAHPFPASS